MLRAFLRMPLRDKVALALAWVLLGCAAALLRVASFKRIVCGFGRPTGGSGYVPAVDERQAHRALLVRRAVARAVTAHAWTIAGDVTVTGGKTSQEHSILARFLSPSTSLPDHRA